MERRLGRLLCVGAIIAALGVNAQAREWKVNYTESELSFISKQMNVPVDGNFKRFTAELRFDPQQPEGSFARIDIDMKSVSTGIDDADEEVKGRAWLDVAAYSTATFESSSVTRVGPDRYAAAGTLSIKGTARPATLPFTVKAMPGGALQLAGEYTMNRLDFKIGGGVWGDTDVVADEVKLRYRLLLRP